MEDLAKLLADMMAEQQEMNRLLNRIADQFNYPIAVRESERPRRDGF